MKTRQNATRILKTFCSHPQVRHTLSVCLDTVFPPRCPVCDGISTGGLGKPCPACRTALKPLRGALCMKCSKPLQRDGQDAEYCPACEKREHAFDRAFSVFDYKYAAPSVYRFKYLGRVEYAEYYADCFVRRYGGLPRGVRIDALVPVPLHPDKHRKRGYNQAEAFARALSARIDTPVRTDLVARVRPTRPQKELDYAGRLNNLKNAFIIRKNDVECNSVALVDDIFTTGSTADYIAALLKKHGVRTVYVFTPAMATNSVS